MKNKKTSNIHSWVIGLASLIILQVIFIICDLNSWSPFREFKAESLFERITNSTVFTAWFTPYNNPAFNAFTALFTVTLLPYVLIGFGKMIITIFSHKEKAHKN